MSRSVEHHVMKNITFSRISHSVTALCKNLLRVTALLSHKLLNRHSGKLAYCLVDIGSIGSRQLDVFCKKVALRNFGQLRGVEYFVKIVNGF